MVSHDSNGVAMASDCHLVNSKGNPICIDRAELTSDDTGTSCESSSDPSDLLLESDEGSSEGESTSNKLSEDNDLASNIAQHCSIIRQGVS